jgi:hypothetical protein
MKRVVISMIAIAAMLIALSADAVMALPDGGHGSGGDGHEGENEVKFTGAIESLPSGADLTGTWMIAGRTVHVSSSTELDPEHGTFAVGSQVKVEGRANTDGSVDASEIEIIESGEPEDPENEIEFKGTIESLPSTTDFIGDWSVGGKTVHVSASTQVETEHGPIVVGAFVEVKATMRADGSLDASKIEVENNPQGDDGRAEVKGAIETLPASGLVGDWIVAGKVIHVSASTVIDQEHGAAVVGASVEVTGTLNSDGSIDATRIEVKSGSGSSDDSSGSEGQKIGFKGTIQTMPASGLIGDWTIGTRTVHVVSSTKLKTEHGPLVVGAKVKVKGMTMSDGSTVATRIQVKD